MPQSIKGATFLLASPQLHLYVSQLRHQEPKKSRVRHFVSWPQFISLFSIHYSRRRKGFIVNDCSDFIVLFYCEGSWRPLALFSLSSCTVIYSKRLDVGIAADFSSIHLKLLVIAVNLEV